MLLYHIRPLAQSPMLSKQNETSNPSELIITRDRNEPEWIKGCKVGGWEDSSTGKGPGPQTEGR